MMNIEILEDVSACNDQMILKGKRTKRLRPSSSTSSSGGGGSAAEFNYNSLVSSPTTSSGISTSTEEDEDMANCLILLAQGGFSTQIKPEETNFSSRKFTEMATTTNCKVGIYVYECKTCSRTFPSFQALGGHRASHKKPKLTTADSDQKKSPPPPPRAHEEEDTPVPPSSAQFPSKNCNMERNKSKIHECSICGSEFTSGQALGGHMRRHRSATNTTVRSSNDDIVIGEKTRNMLALDLNLPAPPEDDRPETKFHQFSSNPPPHLAFSASALVDCHY